MAPQDTMISATSLAHGHALSFQDQLYLGRIFSTLKQKRHHLTLVIGAGVSMNASLPSWSELVWNMAKLIDDDVLKSMLGNSSTDTLERRAETAIHIACAANKNIDAMQIIRDGLYSQAKVPTPGLLALSIGRLAALYFPNVSVLTTNFDLVLEEAFKGCLTGIPIKPFSMDDYSGWLDSENQSDTLGVLHLHGVVRQGGQPPLRPVILTDSDFLEHGARVRKAVGSAISTGTTLFIGLSLTDPNIVGPLYETTNTGTTERYGLFVPRLHGGGFKPEEHARYGLAGAEFLRTKLGLAPIFLKSYSQLNQLVAELRLAVAEPNLYRRNAPKASSLHYGTRFREALTQAYTAVGAHDKTGELDANGSFALSRKLYDALHSQHGPMPLLRRYTI
jgi:SIR2-like domain